MHSWCSHSATTGSGYAPGDTVTVDKSLIAGSGTDDGSANLVVTLQPSDSNTAGGLDIDVGSGGVDLKSSGQVSLFTSNTDLGSFSETQEDYSSWCIIIKYYDKYKWCNQRR